MRILLIQSPLGRREPPVLPIGLAWLAAGLGDRYQPRIVDPNVADPGAIEQAIRTWEPQVVGLSLRNVDTTQVKDPYCFYAAFPPLVRRIRHLVGPDVPLVAGGPGFSLFARPIMERVPELDFGVHLEGERTFPRLLDNLDQPWAVPGVLYRRDGEVQFTGPGEQADIHALSPRLDLLDIARYRPWTRNYSVGVQTKRGCALSCSYCTYRVLQGAQVRVRPPEAVVDEVEWLVKDHGIDQLFFADPVFNIPPSHAEAIVSEIERRHLKVRWRAYHNERCLDRSYMRRAVASGCTEFTFSPDGWSPRTLRLLDKNVRPQDIRESLDLIRDVEGAIANYNFFLGIPGQDLQELAQILAFYLQARRTLGPRLQGFRLGYVRIEPHTALHRTLVELGAVAADDPLLPETDDQVARLFHRQTGNRWMDAFCHHGRVHRWPLSRRRVQQAGDELHRRPLRSALRALSRAVGSLTQPAPSPPPPSSPS